MSFLHTETLHNILEIYVHTFIVPFVVLALLGFFGRALVPTEAFTPRGQDFLTIIHDYVLPLFGFFAKLLLALSWPYLLAFLWIPVLGFEWGGYQEQVITWLTVPAYTGLGMFVTIVSAIRFSNRRTFARAHSEAMGSAAPLGTANRRNQQPL